MNRLTSFFTRFSPSMVPLFLLCACFLTAAPSSAQAEEQPARIGMLPLELLAPQEMDYLRDGVRTMLGSRLAAGGQAILLERDKVEGELTAGEVPGRAAEFAALGRRLQADYLVGGMITAVGGGLSLDLEVYEIAADGKSHSFFTSAASEDEVIPKVNELAAEIRASLLAPTAPEVARPAPAQAPPSQQPTYVSPHPERQLFDAWSAGGSPFIRSGDVSWLRGYSKSHDIPMGLRAMEAADITGDGEMEFILAGPDRVEVYRREMGRFLRLGQIDTLNRYPVHYISAADLNGNGRAEIYLSAADHRGPRSQIVEWDGERLVRTHDNLNWYIRVMRLPMEGKTLVGQQAGAGSFMRPGLRRLHPTADGSLETGSPLSIPARFNLFDFVYADLDGDGAEEIIAINQNERLEVYNAGGGRLWRSDGYYGGTTRHLGGTDIREEPSALPHEVAQHYVPSRIIIRDITQNGLPDVVVTKANPTLGRAVGRVRSYSSGEVHALRWDGMGMSEIWRTRRIDGYISDIQLGPDIEATDEEGRTRRGSELYVGVTLGGEGFTSLAATAQSAVFVYPVEYQEAKQED